ncbi:hypothetical protein HPP92_021593 [Vanilla planifolia]|uniref:Protein kinase domain-containing protein n=1 Tax=Vanilla planifolia TaxID=51239 RepID=A0A835PZE8_VANPL|nr:hypothetical protein HPP92_021593 [Vanilla planifolia]
MPSSLLGLLVVLLASVDVGSRATAGFSPCHPPTSCGNLSNIYYPFWVYTHNLPSSFCGYQSFAIHCHNNISYIPLSDADSHLAVVSINYSHRIISLFDPISNSASASCPRPSPASSTNAFPFAPLLTFFLNCSSTPFAHSPASGGPIPCLKSGTKISYMFMGEYDSSLYWPCEQTITNPASRAMVDYMATKERQLGVMREGFELQWPEMGSGECGDCERSGGQCGYQQIGANASRGVLFGCYCGAVDGWRKRDCGKKKKHKALIIGTSVAAGTLVIAILHFICFWYRRRRRQKKRLSPSSSFFNRSSITRLPFSDKDGEHNTYPYQTHIFSYDELYEATKSFDKAMEIGDGGCGTVYKGTLRDGRIVAVKRLYETNFKREEQFANEIVILSRLRHQNLVSLYGSTSPRSRELLLVYEFVPNGTVADHLHGPRAAERRLTWPIRLSIAVETAMALAYLHAVDPPIVHRDVKSGNILLDAEFHVKIADFGISRLFPADGATHISTVPQGTPGYLDPEYHSSYQLTDRSDVYSFGVVLAELISSKPAVDLGRKRAEINLSTMAVNRIQGGELHDLVDRSLGYDSDASIRRVMGLVAELAFRCLQADREMRPAIKEALELLKALQSGASLVSETVEQNVEQMVGKSCTWPISPDSVAEKWVSRSSTPNASQ